MNNTTGVLTTLSWQPTYVVNGNLVSMTYGSYTGTLVLEIKQGDASESSSVADASLEWASYIGVTNGWSFIKAVDTDNASYPVYAGHFLGGLFPISIGYIENEFEGGQDAFVFRLNGDNMEPIWATFVGGTGSDDARAIAIRNSSEIYITGLTKSTDFPLNMVGDYATDDNADALNNHSDGFIAQLKMDGVVQWSTCYGDDNQDESFDCIEVTNDVITVGGNLCDGCNTNLLENELYTEGNGLIVQFDIVGNRLFATQFPSVYRLYSVTADADGNWIFGGEGRTGLPILNNDPNYQHSGTFQALGDPATGGILFKLNSNNELVFSEYINISNASEAIKDVVCAANGDIYLVGHEYNYNALGPAIETIQGNGTYHMSEPLDNGGYEAFIGRVSPTGIVEWMTYFGNGFEEKMSAINLDAAGNPIIVGSTSSGFNNTYNLPFPTANPPQAFVQSQNNGDSQLRSDMFIAHFDANQNLKWVTYWGGDKDETGFCATVAANNRMYVGGTTTTMNINNPVNPLPLEEYNTELGTFDWWQEPTVLQSNLVWSYGARFNLDLVYTIGLDELSSQINLLVYPNPSQSQISIAGLTNQRVEYTIFDSVGKIVAVQQNAQPQLINIAQLSAGLYNIQLKVDGLLYQIQFVKQ